MRPLLYILAFIILGLLVSCQGFKRQKAVIEPQAQQTPAQQIDTQNRVYMANHGRRALVWGLMVLVGGGALSAAFKVYLPRKIGDVVYYAGGGMAVLGLVLMESAKRLHILGFIAIVALGGFVLHRLKLRGIGK